MTFWNATFGCPWQENLFLRTKSKIAGKRSQESPGEAQHLARLCSAAKIFITMSSCGTLRETSLPAAHTTIDHTQKVRPPDSGATAMQLWGLHHRSPEQAGGRNHPAGLRLVTPGRDDCGLGQGLPSLDQTSRPSHVWGSGRRICCPKCSCKSKAPALL